MRIAELATAAGLILLSIWFMFLATELPIGWERGEGPGGGAFPFWLSAGMLVCSVAILFREFRRPQRYAATPSRRTRVFIHPAASGQLAGATIGLIAMVAMIHWLGVYIAIPAFMIGYLKIIGRTGWVLPILLGLCTALFMFFFFEVTLKILLPKGITEPLFYPLYAMFF